jgi:hypothetical protein
VACVIRGVLAQKTIDAAVDFLNQVKHASGQNYVLGGPENVYSFECSHQKVCRYIPTDSHDLVWHTNHPLANDDYDAKYQEAIKRAKFKHPTNSETRFQCVQSRLQKAGEATDVDAIKSILTSHDSPQHPVCRPLNTPSGVFTFGSTIMVLSGTPELHIAPGPPDVVPYQVLSFGGSTVK